CGGCATMCHPPCLRGAGGEAVSPLHAVLIEKWCLVPGGARGKVVVRRKEIEGETVTNVGGTVLNNPLCSPAGCQQELEVADRPWE
ncbi:Ribosomal protein S12 methylthiotransferase RimO, partial [Dissostichus eleginoides]